MSTISTTRTRVRLLTGSGCRSALEGLVCHSDAGSHFTSLRYSERIAEIGAVPSIGSIGHPYDNALAETVNSLSKTELIRQQGPWRSIDDVTPTEYEAAYTLHRAEADQPVGIQ